jgi:tripartite-type tricarboxylate transporter receptor subunit TctC
MAVMAPAGVPRDAIARLNAEITRIVRDPAMKASLWDRQWIDPLGSTPPQTAEIIRAETARWARIARSLNLAAQ